MFCGKTCPTKMWTARWEPPTSCPGRKRPESGGRHDQRAGFREHHRPCRDDQRRDRRRSRSREREDQECWDRECWDVERGDRYHYRVRPKRYQPSLRHDASHGPGRAPSSVQLRNLCRSPPRYSRAAPPPPPPLPRRPDSGNVPRISASHGQNPFCSCHAAELG